MKHIRKMGAYYTPAYVAKAMTRWAIRSPEDKVLDPSFGGCAFVGASLSTLRLIRAERPEDNVYGYDIDPIAFEHLNKLVGRYDRERFFDLDFLQSDSQHKFDVVIGNPPYIKYDNIPKNALTNAKISMHGIIDEMGRSNYWAYFVILSASRLNLGGRMAFILPRSFIESDYSEIIRNHLRQHFSKIEIYPIQDQIFDDTNEATILVLFEDYSIENILGSLKVFEISLAVEICKKISNLTSKSAKKESSIIQRNIGLPSTSIEKSMVYLRDISRKYNIFTFGKFFDVKIGIVTGGKEFFILDDKTIKSYSIDRRFVRPVISKASSVNEIDHIDLDKLPYLLTIPENYKIDGLYSDENLDKYLLSVSDKVRNSYHAKNRKPWYSVRNVYASEAVFKNIVSGDALIYLNSQGVLCTNNLLRLIAIGEVDLLSIALYSKTSLFQLSAYTSGRKYGRRAIKFEPSRLKAAIIPYTDLQSIYSRDFLIDLSKKEQNEIDILLLHDNLGITLDEIQEIRMLLKDFKHRNFTSI